MPVSSRTQGARSSIRRLARRGLTVLDGRASIRATESPERTTWPLSAAGGDVRRGTDGRKGCSVRPG